MYDEIIDRIVASLPENRAVHRRPHYARLRTELEKELRKAHPPLTKGQMRARQTDLEEAIQRREGMERDAIPDRVKSGDIKQ